MKFSVLMSVYYKENPEYFDNALKSTIEQSRPPSEIVLVKDGKLTKELDGIIDEYCAQYSDIFKIVSLDKNHGLGEALRIGLDNCSNEIVARMDTDDICLYNRFEKQLEVLTNDSGIDIVGSWISEFEGDTNNIIAVREVPASSGDIEKKAKYRNPLNHMTVMFKKSSVIKAGGYKTFLWNEDYYLWVRMILKGCKILNLQESLVLARVGEDMVKRRGGIKYSLNEIKLQKEFFNLGFINLFQFSFNVTTRSIIRVIPNKLRKFVYFNMLRA